MRVSLRVKVQIHQHDTQGQRTRADRIRVRVRVRVRVTTFRAPVQILKKSLKRVVTSARNALSADLLPDDFDGAERIEEELARQVIQSMPLESDRRRLQQLQSNALWTHATLYTAGIVTQPRCPYCRCADQTLMHLLWECP